MTAHRGKIVSKAEFKRMWEDLSMTLPEIGAILDINPTAVRKRAIKRGLPGRTVRRRRTPIDEARIKAMLLARVDRLEIAADLKISKNTVVRWSDRLGLSTRLGKPLLTLAQFNEKCLFEKMQADAAEVRAHWALAEMVDRAAHSSGRRAA